MKRVAILGFGPHGKRMLKVASDMDGLDVVAIADRSALVFDGLSLNGIKTYSDAARLFDAHEIDVCIITTNGPSHFALTNLSVLHGVKRLFVSKPIACTLAEAKRMVELAARHDVRLVVDHGLRHDNTYKYLREKIHSGAWGELRSVYVMRNGIGLGCLGVHSFDLINFLVGGTPLSVSGWVDKPVRDNPRGKEFVDPGGLVIIHYENNVKGIVSQIEDASGPMSVEINLTGGRIRVNESFREIDIVTKDSTQVARPGKPVPFEKVALPESITVCHDVFELMRSILAELVSDRPIQCDAAQGERSIEILVAAYLSHERGNTPIAMPLTGESALTKFLPIT